MFNIIDQWYINYTCEQNTFQYLWILMSFIKDGWSRNIQRSKMAELGWKLMKPVHLQDWAEWPLSPLWNAYLWRERPQLYDIFWVYCMNLVCSKYPSGVALLLVVVYYSETSIDLNFCLLLILYYLDCANLMVNWLEGSLTILQTLLLDL